MVGIQFILRMRHCAALILFCGIARFTPAVPYFIVAHPEYNMALLWHMLPHQLELAEVAATKTERIIKSLVSVHRYSRRKHMLGVSPWLLYHYLRQPEATLGCFLGQWARRISG